MPALLHLSTEKPNVHQFSSPNLYDIYKLGLLNGAFFKDKILKQSPQSEIRNPKSAIQ
jgi:hypothetical protein